MSIRYTLRGYLWCFWCSCCGVHVMSNKWNEYNFQPFTVIYMRAHVNSSDIAIICWLIHTFRYQCRGFQVHLKSILVYNMKTKSDFWLKSPRNILGYIMNLGSIFFLFALVLNLAYIDYSLCQIWSVYMPYLRYYDRSNKCLFLVIQEAEVLPNFLVSVCLIDGIVNQGYAW